MSTPFEYDEELTAVVLMMPPSDSLIADIVAPYAPVGRQNFYYYQHSPTDFRAIQETAIGRRSEANMVEFSATRKDASVIDHALRDVVPMDDIDNAPTGYNPRHVAAEGLAELITFQREVRVAQAYADASNYGKQVDLVADNRKKLSDKTVNPLNTLDELIQNCYYSPNVMTLSGEDLFLLRRHPKVIKAYHGNTGEDGKVPIAYIEDYLSVKVAAGEGKLPRESESEGIDFSRVWQRGNVSLVTIDNKGAITSKTPSFMRTARLGKMKAARRDTAAGGVNGGIDVQVSERVNEVVISKACGQLITNAF